MNKKPIENALDADLRISMAALIRAARHAYALAAETGTCIVISEDGCVQKICPKSQVLAVGEPHADYKE